MPTILFGVPIHSRSLQMTRSASRSLPRAVVRWMRIRWISVPPRRGRVVRGDPEHLRLLQEGREQWNQMREQHRTMGSPPFVPKLMGFNLRGLNLDHYDLTDARLEEAILRGSSLHVANLRGADLIRADLRKANLFGAWLDDRETDLRDADLRGANLQEALLDSADIRGARGVVLDSTRIRNARFSPTASDPWSVLRKRYTGPSLILNLMFLVAFLVPYVLKSVGWIGVNRAEIAIDSSISRIAEKVDEIAAENDAIAKILRSLAEDIAQHAPNEENGWRKYYLWQVIVGFDRPVSYWITAIALILYNLLRAMLTVLVAPLRDEEERSGHSPVFSLLQVSEVSQSGSALERFRYCYGWMIWPHRIVRLLFLVAVVAFVYHMWTWLLTPILLPPLKP